MDAVDSLQHSDMWCKHCVVQLYLQLASAVFSQHAGTALGSSDTDNVTMCQLHMSCEHSHVTFM